MKHAIVVGASSGIGAAVARDLETRGHAVSTLSRTAGEQTKRWRWTACDVTSDASVEAALRTTIEAGGPPDVLVYSAGAMVAGLTLDVPEAAARDVFEVNYWGMRRVIRRVYPAMAERRSGSIAVVLSIAAIRAIPFESEYAASKAACARWLDCFALEAERDGVRVGYLAPGFVPTGFLEKSRWFGMPVPTNVQGSNVTEQDVARAAVDLALGNRSRIRAVFGWRENTIALADRVAPGLYDRVLRARQKK